VSSAVITLCVASERMFVLVISLSTQSGNFWIHSRVYEYMCFFLEMLTNCKKLKIRESFEKFVDWRQCAAVMQREA
jgi:hypothetical protein